MKYYKFSEEEEIWTSIFVKDNLDSIYKILFLKCVYWEDLAILIPPYMYIYVFEIIV